MIGIYIITNKRNTALYTGSTTHLKKRVYFHKKGLLTGFSKKYNLDKLVYYEVHKDISSARRTDIQIKKGSRKSKISLIEKLNPKWHDLYPQLK